jgi:hypothetical protein
LGQGFFFRPVGRNQMILSIVGAGAFVEQKSPATRLCWITVVGATKEGPAGTKRYRDAFGMAATGAGGETNRRVENIARPKGCPKRTLRDQRVGT